MSYLHNEISGVEVAKRLNENGGKSNVSMIVFTVLDDEEIQENEECSLFDGYLITRNGNISRLKTIKIREYRGGIDSFTEKRSSPYILD